MPSYYTWAPKAINTSCLINKHFFCTRSDLGFGFLPMGTLVYRLEQIVNLLMSRWVALPPEHQSRQWLWVGYSTIRSLVCVCVFRCLLMRIWANYMAATWCFQLLYWCYMLTCQVDWWLHHEVDKQYTLLPTELRNFFSWQLNQIFVFLLKQKDFFLLVMPTKH